MIDNGHPTPGELEVAAAEFESEHRRLIASGDFRSMAWKQNHQGCRKSDRGVDRCADRVSGRRCHGRLCRVGSQSAGEGVS
jgi:hypothetical protein